MTSGQTHKYRVAAYRGGDPYAFVSYAHEDSAIVFVEMEALAAQGLRFYYDEGIHPGHTWDDELAAAIQKCAVFVFFVTGRSAASQNCRREIAFAIEHERPVIAVHLEDVELPAGLRLSIGNRQAIVRSRFDEPRYRERLIAAIREHVGDATGASAEMPPTPAVVPPPSKRGRRFRMWIFATIAVVAVAGAYVGVTLWRNSEATRIAHDERLAKIEQLIQRDQYGAAFTLAHPLIARDSKRSDVRLQALWKQIVVPGTPLAAEAGATLSYKPYADAGDWILAGTTPIEGLIDLPKGVVRIRLEKPGFQTGEFVVANPGPSVKLPAREFLKAGFAVPDVPLALAPEGKLPDDMVLVPATNEPVFLDGWAQSVEGDYQRKMPEFAIARFEVTNRQYKEFVDAGGYDNAAYWNGLEFRDDGRVLTWAEARARFVDSTGRPGPSGWELSSFPTGQGDMPVGGISWYEAVAYSRFSHLALPTIHHWLRAAFAPFEGMFETAPAIAGTSRLSADGPVEAHSELGLGPWGTVNAAGNVREWIWNRAGDQAIALGGAWSDDDWAYKAMHTVRAMDRSPTLGMRLMKSADPVGEDLLAPIALPMDEKLAGRAPVTDDAFEAMRFQFTAGDRTPRSVKVTPFAESDTWTAEEVELSFGTDETFSVYLVLPRGHRGRLQPILYGPPTTPFGAPQPNRDVLEHLRTADVIVSGGRALVIPIWAATYRRIWPPTSDLTVLTDLMRRASLDWYKDAVTTLGYLATREDMDMQRAGYMGMSFGSIFIGPPLLAIEGRLRAAVFVAAGVWTLTPLHPMFDVVNYASRIHVPILMINGRYDSVVPLRTQERLFELLGTPSADKRQVVYDVSHFTYPHSQLAKEVNDWFDKYLGPAK